MSRIYYSLLMLTVVAFVKCKSHKNSTDSAGSEATAAVMAQSAENDLTMRFIVSFYSIGSGIEGKEREKLIETIRQFSKAENKELTYNTVNWGREGETDFCFPLKELTTEKQKEFIEKTQKVLKSAKWVHYFENATCRKGR